MVPPPKFAPDKDFIQFKELHIDCAGLELFDGVKRIYSHQERLSRSKIFGTQR